MITKCAVIQVTNDAQAEHMGPGISQKGTPYDSWSQTGYLWTGAMFPTPISFRFDVLKAAPDAKNYLPLAPGYYAIPSGVLRAERGNMVARFESAPVPLADAIAEFQGILKAGASGAPAAALRAAS